MAVVIRAEKLVAMEYHQGREGALMGDPDYRPGDWSRQEFYEADRATRARENTGRWLMNSPPALRHAQRLMSREKDEQDGAGALAAWLDRLFYGAARLGLSQDEWAAAQLCADAMAREDFSRMDFRRLAADAEEFELPEADA